MKASGPAYSASTVLVDDPAIVGLDPRSTEASWIAFTVEALPDGHRRSIGVDLRQIASIVWSPEVPVALISEFRLSDGESSWPSTSTLAVGVHGAGGDSASNALAIADELERVVSDRVSLLRRSPEIILSPPEVPYCFRMCQAPARPGGFDHLEVPTVWHTFPNPQRHLAAAALRMNSEMRVRTTYLSTTPSVDDRGYLDRGARQVAELASTIEPHRVNRLRVIERAMASYRYLANRLDGPLWVGEIAVASTRELAWSQRQLLAGSVTSASGLHWGEAGPHILDTGPFRGGFEIEDLHPAEVVAAHRCGLPVHGGVRARTIHDLFSVTGLLWDVPPPATVAIQEEMFPQIPRQTRRGMDPF